MSGSLENIFRARHARIWAGRTMVLGFAAIAAISIIGGDGRRLRIRAPIGPVHEVEMIGAVWACAIIVFVLARPFARPLQPQQIERKELSGLVWPLLGMGLMFPMTIHAALYALHHHVWRSRVVLKALYVFLPAHGGIAVVMVLIAWAIARRPLGVRPRGDGLGRYLVLGVTLAGLLIFDGQPPFAGMLALFPIALCMTPLLELSRIVDAERWRARLFARELRRLSLCSGEDGALSYSHGKIDASNGP